MNIVSSNDLGKNVMSIKLAVNNHGKTFIYRLIPAAFKLINVE
jgi:hypothetical protein